MEKLAQQREARMSTHTPYTLRETEDRDGEFIAWVRANYESTDDESDVVLSADLREHWCEYNGVSDPGSHPAQVVAEISRRRGTLIFRDAFQLPPPTAVLPLRGTYNEWAGWRGVRRKGR